MLGEDALVVDSILLIAPAVSDIRWDRHRPVLVQQRSDLACLLTNETEPQAILGIGLQDLSR
jgi:hypothetical protein